MAAACLFLLSCSDNGCQMFNLRRTSWALSIYRDTVSSGIMPTVEIVSQVLGCLRIPYDAALRNRIFEELGLSSDLSRYSSLCALLDGFGEYDPRSVSVLEVSEELTVLLL